MSYPNSHDEQFYAEVPLRRNRPSSSSSYSPFFMHQQTSTSGGGSNEPSYGQSRYDWVHSGLQGSRTRPISSDKITDSYSSESPENAARYSYGAADLVSLSEEVLSPGPADEMHAIEKKTPRFGASRYISESSGTFTLWSARGWANLYLYITARRPGSFCLAILGWPILAYFREHTLSDLFAGPNGRDIGFRRAVSFFLCLNVARQALPTIPSSRELVDPDTPREAKSRVGADGEEYELVFSDEFNVDGRTFWKGDDPFWEAADQHYWPTGDREWYDPDGARTEGGSLVIQMRKMDPGINHNLEYRSAMLTSWNKLCFTGGYMEGLPRVVQRALSFRGDMTSVDFGVTAIWTMGNLARPGYGATTDGTWPYSYDSCDVGAMPNQTDPKTGAPGSTILTAVRRVIGARRKSEISLGILAKGLVGAPALEKSKSCSRNLFPSRPSNVCGSSFEWHSSHPGPITSDGTYKGRSSPEIDMIEAYSYEKTATAYGSQSLQIAPYDDKRTWDAKLGSTYSIYPESGFTTTVNPYHGGNRQQTLSSLATIPPSNCSSHIRYVNRVGRKQIHALWSRMDTCKLAVSHVFNPSATQAMLTNTDFLTPTDKRIRTILICKAPNLVATVVIPAADAFPFFCGSTWSLDRKPTWTLNSTALKPNPRSMVGQRLISNEPMYMILNLGLSDTFVPVNEASLTFPAHMRIDYVRFVSPFTMPLSRNGWVDADTMNTLLSTNAKITKTSAVVRRTTQQRNTLPVLTSALSHYRTWSQAGYTFPKTTIMDGCKTP
ncbi:uncharacterized protein VP01_370g1 [Puccinia sorghi]|uniref:GH16 domain-containing protein n=1 Tax=Puccinia sorghi TaxID=27349 RepID=A0A0L6UUX3_9BASI|nr:uncharacterized protein VP01_370g1 [Puccinia sorghi]